MIAPPRTVFLDQNKWIDLAHAFDSPKHHARSHEIGCGLIDAIKSGKLQCPLTSSVILETYRMTDIQHRMMIAEVQAVMSQGRVFRDRNFLIRHEIAEAILQTQNEGAAKKPPLWWMSKYFIEAFVDFPRAVAQFGLEPDQVVGLQFDPKFALFHWISTTPEEERSLAIDYYEKGSRELIERIAVRIERLRSEKFGMRQRVYTASLALDEINRIVSVGAALGLGWTSLNDIGPQSLKRILRNVATYHVEIALASRIESLDRMITTNDLRDMHSYVSAIPNADVVVGEKLFVNVALQAGLGKRYGCELYSDLSELDTLL